ncbi:MAG: fumarylacetoacetase, partial [Bacteroidota bacterium]
MQPFLDLPSDTGFGLANLPYGVFSTAADPSPRVGVRLGDHVVDLAHLEAHGLLAVPGTEADPVFRGTLNRFMSLGRGAWDAVRERLQDLLSAEGSADLRSSEAHREAAIVALADVTMHLPAAIG